MSEMNNENKAEDEAKQNLVKLPVFLHEEYGVVGRTVSTKSEPNTSSRFQFWVADRDEAIGRIQIGNIVAAYTDGQDDITFASVVEMRSYSDVDSFIADYLSHNFGEADTKVPTDISEVIVVTCAVMRNVSATTKPVGRSRVYFPSALGIQFAYGILNEFGENVFTGASIPIGIFENGDGTIAPISVDEDFLVGPEGAPLNVTGISGLASKTSAIQFVLKSLQTHTKKKVAIVMFNVKSKDLLYIDQPNQRLQKDDWSQNAYKELGIGTEAFSDIHFVAPADPTGPDKTQSLRELPVNRFQWDLQMMYQSVPALFNSLDWDDKMEGVWFNIREEIEAGNLLTYSQMLTWIKETVIDKAGQNQWPRGNHISVWNKMLSHLKRFPRSYSGLIATAGQGKDIPWSKLRGGRTYVVDIQMLNDRGQRLVFGRAIQAISDLLEAGQSNLDSIVVFVDELNKFAPAGNERSPLKSSLIDITARGRSMGLVLFGAEQFASSVEKQIIENSSTFLFGRTESNELRSPSYSAFSDEVKTKLMTLPQGRMLVKFSKFPQPIFIRFPFPTCLPGDQFSMELYEQEKQNKGNTNGSS